MHHDKINLYDRHVDKVNSLYERIQFKQAILNAWEKEPKADYDYLLGLRKRIRESVCRLNAMKPIHETDLDE